MSRRALFGLVGAAVAVALVFFAARALRKKAPDPLVPGPETTVITGPLDAAGLIDYETALNEKLKGKSTPETNAVVLLLKVTGPKPEKTDLKPDFYKWLGTTPPPEEGDYLLRPSDYFREEQQGENPQAFQDREDDRRTRPWTEADDPKFFAFVTANEKPLAVAAEASRRPHYFHPMIARDQNGNRTSLINALLPLPQRVRDIASLLSLRTMLRCGEKNYDAAWEDVMTLHRLGRLMGQGGTLIERLIGLALDAIATNSALRVLEAAKPTAAKALAWRDQLAALPPMPSMADSADFGERYMFLDVAQFLQRDWREMFKGNEIPYLFRDLPKEVVTNAMPRLDWNRVLRAANARYDRLADALRKPTRAERIRLITEVEVECLRLLGALKDAPSDELIADAFSTAFLPVVAKVHEAMSRQEVQSQTELLAFALAAYHADNKKYPATLADLVPKYAKAIPNDPYSEKEFVYKPTATGYELYSVGPNGTDDGGQSLNDDPRGDDYGVRVPNVKRAPVALPDDGQ